MVKVLWKWLGVRSNEGKKCYSERFEEKMRKKCKGVMRKVKSGGRWMGWMGEYGGLGVKGVEEKKVVMMYGGGFEVGGCKGGVKIVVKGKEMGIEGFGELVD